MYLAQHRLSSVPIKRIGNTTAATAYSGRFKISESTDGNTYTVKYTSSSDQTRVDYTPSSTAIKTIRSRVYMLTGGTTTLLDTQTVTIIADGKNGGNGKGGTSAVEYSSWELQRSNSLQP